MRPITSCYVVVIRSRIEKARTRALLMLQGQDATVSVSRPTAAARTGSYQADTAAADLALYPPLVEKFYDVDTRGRHGRGTGRCACSAHAHWTPYVDEEAAVGLVDGVDVVPEMEFTSRSAGNDTLFAVCY